METPTYDSLIFKLLKHREGSIRCNGHIYLFTKESLSMMVESCNFRVIKHEKVGRTLTLDQLMTNLDIIISKRSFFESIA